MRGDFDPAGMEGDIKKPAPIARGGPEIEEDLPDSTRQYIPAIPYCGKIAATRPFHALGGALTVVLLPTTICSVDSGIVSAS